MGLFRNIKTKVSEKIVKKAIEKAETLGEFPVAETEINNVHISLDKDGMVDLRIDAELKTNIYNLIAFMEQMESEN